MGAATVGESGGRPMRPRIRRVARGPAGRTRLSRAVHPGDNLAIHVAVAAAPAGQRAGGRRGRRGGVRVLGRGAHHRGRDPGCGRPRDRRRRPRPSALAAHGFPVLLHHRGAARCVEEPSRDRRVPVDVGGVSVAAGDWLVGDADGVAVVGAAALDDVLGAGPGPRRKEEAMFAALRRGEDDASSCLGLDASPVEGLKLQAVTRFGGGAPRAPSHTPWHATPGHLGPGGATGAADVGEQTVRGALSSRGWTWARLRRRRVPPRRPFRHGARRRGPPRPPPDPGPCSPPRRGGAAGPAHDAPMRWRVASRSGT